MAPKTEKPDHGASVPRRRGLVARFRANFLTGLVVIMPMSLTIWLIWTLTGWIDSWVLPLVPYHLRPEQYIGINLRGVGVIIFLLFTGVVGWVAKGLLGRSLIGWGERIVDRMPIVRSIYNGVKQVAETVFSQTDSKFETACLIEYPRPGIWAIGFVSIEARGEVLERLPADEVMTIFLPTTPNPTSGFLLYVPREDVTFLDMTVEDAAKLVISAGLVYPAPKTNGGSNGK